MTLNTVYEGAQGCTGYATPGVRAFMSWYLGKFGHLGATNLGIYNCRRIAGADSAWSLHAEGRAGDLGVPAGDPDWAAALAEFMANWSLELGVQLVIYRRRIWSAAHPNAGWRDYGGSNPHTDHIHGEFTWSGARTLTVPTIESVFTGLPPAAPAPSWEERLLVKLPLLRGGSSGRSVKKVQALANLWGVGIQEDGQYGPRTEAAVTHVQRSTGIRVDGIVGPITWEALLTR